MKDELAKFLAARDKALTLLDMKWARKMLPGASDDLVLLITMHKTRYNCPTIATPLRLESAEWLRAGGFKDLHGIELLPRGELPM
jgi:hypothetical protein